MIGIKHHTPHFLFFLFTWLEVGIPVTFAQEETSQVFEIQCLSRSDRTVIAGSNGTLRIVGEPKIWSLDANGSALAEGALSLHDEGVDQTNNRAVFRLTHDAEAELLLREGDLIDGGVFRRIYHLSEDDHGRLAILAEVGEAFYPGNQYNGPHFQAILWGKSGSLDLIASSRNGKTLKSLRQTNAGHIAFYSTGSLWMSSGDEVIPVITPDTLPPGLPWNATKFRLLDDRGLLLDDTGKAYFGAVLTTETESEKQVQSITRTGIYLWDGAKVRLLAQEGQAAPGWPEGALLAQPSLRDVSGSGFFLFDAGIRDGDSNIIGSDHFGGFGEDLKLLTKPPGEDGPFNILQISHSGRIMATTGNQENGKIWLSGKAIETQEWSNIFSTQDKAPGYDGNFVWYEDLHLATDGTLLVNAAAQGDRGATRGVWVLPENSTELIPASIIPFRYDRGGGSFSIILRNSGFPKWDATILPLFGSSFGGAGRMQLVRNSRMALEIYDTCPAVVQLSASPPSKPASAKITLHRMSEEGYTKNSKNAGWSEINAPLIPVTEPAILSQQPKISKGLVVDGVTPLVISVKVENFSEGDVFTPRLDDSSMGLQVLVSGDESNEWTDAAGMRLLPQQTGDQYFFAIMPPSVESFRIPDGAFERTIQLSLLDASKNEEIATLRIPLRKPPVVLVTWPHTPPFKESFKRIIERSRGDGFAVNGYASLSGLNNQWAFTRPDAIFHSSSESVFDMINIKYGRSVFRNTLENHRRGAWRRLVDLGGSCGGSLTSSSRLEWFLRQTGMLNIIPEGIRNRFNGVVVNRFDKDIDARMHALATGIPMIPGNSPFLNSIGLNTYDRLAGVFPYGGDGLIDRNTALRIPGDQSLPTETWHSIFAEEPVSHIMPELFGVQEEQTGSEKLAQYILDLFDSPASANRFASVLDVMLSARCSLSDEDKHTINDVVDEVTMQIVDRRQAELDSIGILPLPLFGVLQEGLESPATRNFQLVPAPNEPIEGQVVWMAEFHNSSGISAEGIILSPQGEHGMEVEMKIEEDRAGDAVLYASYLSQNGTLVHMPPIIAWSKEPEGVTPNGIVVDLGIAGGNGLFQSNAPGEEPSERVELSPSDFIHPVIYLQYSDGQRVKRFLSPDQMDVTSSNSTIIDVSNPVGWQAKNSGTATISVSALGFSVTKTIHVTRPENRLNFETWKALYFSETELREANLTAYDVDTDQDGLNLVGEYLSGGHPRWPDEDPILTPKVVHTAQDTDSLLSLSLRNEITDFEVSLEISHDLKVWEDFLSFSDENVHASDHLLSMEENGLFTDYTIRVRPSISGRQQLFVRLNAYPIENNETAGINIKIPGLSAKALDSLVAHYDGDHGVEVNEKASVLSWTPVDSMGQELPFMTVLSKQHGDTNLDLIKYDDEGGLSFSDTPYGPDRMYLEGNLGNQATSECTIFWLGYYSAQAPFQTQGTYAYNIGPDDTSHQRDDGKGTFVVEHYNGKTYAGESILAYDGMPTVWTTILTADSHTFYANGTNLNMEGTPSNHIRENASIVIGAYSAAGYDFVGKIKQLLIFDKALDEQDRLLIESYLRSLE